MPSIAITGGIACGKSLAMNFFKNFCERQKKACSFFDADKEVARLLDHEPEVAQEIKNIFGNEVYTEHGKADRTRLRSLMLSSSQHKKQLEEILHPQLKKIWHPQTVATQTDPNSFFIADIPLLFENNLASYFDHVIVVAASEQVQKDRLMEQRRLSPETASALLQLQLPLSEKIKHATFVLWNDGPKENLEKQFLQLAHPLFHMSTPSAEQAPPAPLSLNELQALPYHELLERHHQLVLSLPHDSSRHSLIEAQARHQIISGGELTADGILEFSPENPILRWAAFNFKPCAEDVVVPIALLKQHVLRPGLRLTGKVQISHKQRLTLETITAVEEIPIQEWKTPKEFDQLTAAFPTRRIFLEQQNHLNDTGRVVDLIAPLGMGQRGLIVAPPRVGKTMMLKSLALAIRANHPKIHLMLLLVDERPEEVTDLRASLDCDIFSSTFDEPTTRHVQVSELVAERSKRLVELGQDVVILIDSITRLSRGYNNAIKGKGRTMSGGVDAKALSKPKRFFGSARNVEEGGSLTIIATALVETKSKMDD
ncbi:MAG: transcription termination factor Rho, partial [Verrucomicrobia bacterium]|nr:transcription termination factor Rho [Verrucomicrobiota bacterium]